MSDDADRRTNDGGDKRASDADRADRQANGEADERATDADRPDRQANGGSDKRATDTDRTAEREGRPDGGTEVGTRTPGRTAGATPTLVTDLATARVVATTEMRATLRRLTGNRRQLIGVVLGFGQFVVLWPLVAFGQISGFGAQIAGEQLPVGVLSAGVVGAVVMGAFIGVMSAINRDRIGNVGTLLRSSCPPRAVAIGRLASELLQSVVFFLPSGVAIGVILGIGAGDPVVPVLTALAVFLPLLATVLVGRAVGSFARYAGLLTNLSVWTKALGFLVFVSVGVVGAQVAVSAVVGADFLGVSPDLTAIGAPATAYVETMFALYGGELSLVGVAELLVMLVAVPVGLVAAARAETMILLRDETTNATDSTETTTPSRIPSPFDRRHATRQAYRHLRRTRRDPRSLAHLFSFAIGPVAGSGYLFAQPSAALPLIGSALVVLGTLVAGAAYCLNPLGDDRKQFPLLFTTLPSTAVLLKGRVLAGITLALPLVVVGVPLAALGVSVVYALGLLVVFPVLAVASAGIALGLGSIAPKFERWEYANVERAHPSQPALLGFFLGGSIVFAIPPGTLWLATSGSISPAVGVIGLLGHAAVVLGGAWLGYRYARRRFDTLRLDEI